VRAYVRVCAFACFGLECMCQVSTAKVLPFVHQCIGLCPVGADAHGHGPIHPVKSKITGSGTLVLRSCRKQGLLQVDSFPRISMLWGQPSAAVTDNVWNCHVYAKCKVAVQALLLLEEMASVVVTPFVLYFSLPKCAPEILKFVRSFTTHVEGVGDICSLSAFDFQRHGNAKYGSPLQAPKVAPTKCFQWPPLDVGGFALHLFLFAHPRAQTLQHQ
jgi:hypothetical protein